MDLTNLLYKDNTVLEVKLEQVKVILMMVIVMVYYLLKYIFWDYFQQAFC